MTKELSEILNSYNSGEASFSTTASELVELSEKIGMVVYDWTDESDVILCRFDNDEAVVIDYTGKLIVKKSNPLI